MVVGKSRAIEHGDGLGQLAVACTARADIHFFDGESETELRTNVSALAQDDRAIFNDGSDMGDGIGLLSIYHYGDAQNRPRGR